MTLLLDLFWRDQYLSPNQKNAHLDRDRYFIALAFLIWAELFLAIYPNFEKAFFPYVDPILIVEAPFISELVRSLLYSGFDYDLILLFAVFLLGHRLFPNSLIKTLMIGVGSFVSLTIYRVMIASQLDSSYSPKYAFTKALGINANLLVIVSVFWLLIWIIFHVVLFFRLNPLQKVNPQHALLKLNPRFSEKWQLNPVRYFWLMIYLGLSLMLIQVVSICVIYMDKRNAAYYIREWSLFFDLVNICASVLMFMLMLKRMVNLGWKWTWIVLTIIAFALLATAIVYFYENAYNPSTLVMDSVLCKVMLVAYFVFQIVLLMKPAKQDEQLSVSAEEK